MVSSLTIARKGEYPARALGIASAFAGPLIALPPVVNGSGTLGAVIGAGFLACALCLIIGMRRLRVTGSSKAAAVLFWVQIIALILASGQQVQDALLAHPQANGLLYTVCDMAWPFGMCLWVVVWGFVVRANVWHGWRRGTVPAPGLCLLSFFIVMATVGREAAMFTVIPLPLAFLLLGIAVATTRRDAGA